MIDPSKEYFQNLIVMRERFLDYAKNELENGPLDDQEQYDTLLHLYSFQDIHNSLLKVNLSYFNQFQNNPLSINHKNVTPARIRLFAKRFLGLPDQPDQYQLKFLSEIFESVRQFYLWYVLYYEDSAKEYFDKKIYPKMLGKWTTLLEKSTIALDGIE
ncbi:hypothetical protein K1X76_11365 [bacterium]|nr:hypothetical protein [bacterium]